MIKNGLCILLDVKLMAIRCCAITTQCFFNSFIYCIGQMHINRGIEVVAVERDREGNSISCKHLILLRENDMVGNVFVLYSDRRSSSVVCSTSLFGI